MSGDNSPIQLVDAPKFEVWEKSECTETPNGSIDDDGVELLVIIRVLFKTTDDFGRVVRQGFRLPISKFAEEMIVDDMLGKAIIPESIINENPSFASFAAEILLAGQHMVCYRPPEQTFLVLLVEAYLPVNRLPDRDEATDGAARESEFRLFITDGDRDAYADEDSETEAYDYDHDDDNYDDDDDESDYEDMIGFVPASVESIKGLEKVRVQNEPNFDGEECSVCLEELEIDSEATRLPCSHLFHGDCIVKWLNTSNICPLCRSKV